MRYRREKPKALLYQQARIARRKNSAIASPLRQDRFPAFTPQPETATDISPPLKHDFFPAPAGNTPPRIAGNVRCNRQQSPHVAYRPVRFSGKNHFSGNGREKRHLPHNPSFSRKTDIDAAIHPAPVRCPVVIGERFAGTTNRHPFRIHTMPGKITFHRFRTCERQFPVIGIAPRGIRPSDNLHLPSGILQPDNIQRLIQNPAGTGCQRRLVEIEVNP